MSLMNIVILLFVTLEATLCYLCCLHNFVFVFIPENKIYIGSYLII